MRQRSTFLFSALCFGFAFFYIPILSMIFFSFNKSRLATVWGGFSVEWYCKLFKNAQIIEAATLSLEIAVHQRHLCNDPRHHGGHGAGAVFAVPRPHAFFRTCVGAAHHAGSHHRRFPAAAVRLHGALLIGWPAKRGFTTVTIAHTTFALSYVAVIVQSRLSSMDRSLEEAAMDLGSKPWQVLFDVTLPIIAPAMISGWLLAFTISLDDVVITNFTTGRAPRRFPSSSGAR